MIPIPWRYVDAELQSIQTASIPQLSQDVAFAVQPGRPLNRIVGSGRRPKAESIMVLGGDDDPLHPCLFCDPGPLPAVQLRRQKNCRLSATLAPFMVGKRVHTEMDEG